MRHVMNLNSYCSHRQTRPLLKKNRCSIGQYSVPYPRENQTLVSPRTRLVRGRVPRRPFVDETHSPATMANGCWSPKQLAHAMVDRWASLLIEALKVLSWTKLRERRMPQMLDCNQTDGSLKIVLVQGPIARSEHGAAQSTRNLIRYQQRLILERETRPEQKRSLPFVP